MALPRCSGSVPLGCEGAASLRLQRARHRGASHPLFGPPATYATGLNNHGEVVGYFTYLGEDATPFYWSIETGMLPLPSPPAGYGRVQPQDINDHGVVVGWLSATQGALGYRGFVLEGGQYTILNPLPGGAWAAAYAINNAGQVVGWRSLGDSQPGGPDGDTVNPLNAFVWQGGEFTDLGVMLGPNSSGTGITKAGHVVGWTGSCSWCTNARGFLVCMSGAVFMEPIPSGFQSAALAVNDADVAVGFGGVAARTPTGDTLRPLIWSHGNIAELGLPAWANLGTAEGINCDGLVVGRVGFFDGNGVINRGVAWNGDEIIDLNSMVRTPDGSLVTFAGDINDAKAILAHASTPLFLAPLELSVADLNDDCVVSILDLLLLMDAWGSDNMVADLDGDGLVGLSDLGAFLANWK